MQPHVSDRWTPDKPVEEGPVRPSLHLNNNYNQVASTYTYTNHSYLRLKNMEVNYALPKNILGKLGVGRCQVYVNASNLFTISKADSRRDPETSGQDVYPLIRRYNFGFRLGF